MVDNPGATLGQFAGLPGSFGVRLNKASGITITRGLVTKVDPSTNPDSYVTTSAAANQLGPFAIPVETVGTGKTKFSTRYNDVFYLRADGVIEPGSKVQAATATAGEVIAFAETTLGAAYSQAEQQNEQDDPKRVIGTCLGTAETWNTGSPLASADGDLVAVFVPAPGGL